MASSSLSVAVDSIPSLVSSIRSSYSSGSSYSYDWRVAQLSGLLRLCHENTEKITASLAKDLGKPEFEANFSEVLSTSTELSSMLSSLSSWMSDVSVPTPLGLLPGSSFIRSEPYGVCLIISPFNYPFQLSILPLAAALSAGNVCVLKPSELTPCTSSLLSSLLPLYLSQEAVKVVTGAVEETTELLKQKWDYIFFTGSEFVGKIVQRAAADHLTPTTLELGGKSPCIVHSDADLPVAAKRIIWGKSLNCAQTCIAPDYVYVHESVKSQLVSECKKVIKQFHGQNTKESSDYGRIVNKRHTQRLAKLIEEEEGKILCGGEVDVEERFVDLTLVEADESSPTMKEEIFGPILPILSYSDIDSVIKNINSRAKPLSLYVFTRSSSVSNHFLQRTSSGGVTINDTLMHFANPHLPFGGVGSSGIGSYHGKFGFDTFSHKKAVLHRSFSLDAPQRYPKYSKSKFSQFALIAGIHRVNSTNLANALKAAVITTVIAIALWKSGIQITFKP